MLSKKQIIAALVATAFFAGLAGVASANMVSARQEAQNPAILTNNALASNASAEPSTSALSAPRIEWAFMVRAALPSADRLDGSVAVILSNVAGNMSQSVPNASAGVEVAALTWNPLDVPTTNRDILENLNARLTIEPPVALARASLSRNGDGAELTLPSGLNATSVLIHAVDTRDIVVIDWPSGQHYWWASQTGRWLPLSNEQPWITAILPVAQS